MRPGTGSSRRGSSTAIAPRSRRAPAARTSCSGVNAIGRLLLLGGHELGDVRQGIHVIGIGLVGLDRDLEALLQERHELDRGEGVEDAAADEGRRVLELARILAGQELLENERAHRVDDVIHFLASRWARISPACATMASYRPAAII